MAKAEKRHIQRIDSKNSNDYFSTLVFENDQLDYKVLDFNSLSIRICPQNLPYEKSMGVLKLINIKYGKKIIAQIENPLILREESNKDLIVKLENSQAHLTKRTKERLEIKTNFNPAIIAKDPVKIDNILHFEVRNLSSTGLGLKTSLSNKHLLVGLEFNDATLMIPTIGVFIFSFKIRKVQSLQDCLTVGISLINPTKQILDGLAQFSIFGTLPPASTDLDVKLKLIKNNISRIAEIGNGARIEIVNNYDDYAGALKVRLEAYKKAEKTSPEVVTFEQMADEFDLRSIILVAKTDGVIISTVRMVFCKEPSDRFPFEKILPSQYFDDGDKKRPDYYEVSKLAIHPAFQKSDLLIKLFKEVARLTIVNNKTTLCFSTRILRPMYQRIGFEQVSTETPHPMLPKESLALMKIDSQEFIHGIKMTDETWNLFSKDVVENLESFGIIDTKSATSFIDKIEDFFGK